MILFPELTDIFPLSSAAKDEMNEDKDTRQGQGGCLFLPFPFSPDVI